MEPDSVNTGEPDGIAQAPQFKRISLARSLSTKRSVSSWRSANDGSTGAHGNGLHEPPPRKSLSKTRKLQRWPSARSTSSKAASITSSSSAHGHNSHIQSPLASVVSLVSSELDTRGRRRDGNHNHAPHSLPLLPSRGPEAQFTASFNAPSFLCYDPSAKCASEQLERRRISMSKLMRHFGETRIPPGLVTTVSCQKDVDQQEIDVVRPRRTPRAKSLDIRSGSVASFFEEDRVLANSRLLTRSRSLGARKRVDGDFAAFDVSARDNETQRRVKRARKITKIFGPEVAQSLTVMLVEGCNSTCEGSTRSHEVGETALLSTELDEDPMDDSSPIPSRRASSEFTLSAYEGIDDGEDWHEQPEKEEDTPSLLVSEPTTPSTETMVDGRSRRVDKLAKFFGVDHTDVSSSITVVQSALNPGVASVTEIGVHVAGRRFWGISPGKPEYKHARMSDAIQQLRSLKAR